MKIQQKGRQKVHLKCNESTTERTPKVQQRTGTLPDGTWVYDSRCFHDDCRRQCPIDTDMCCRGIEHWLDTVNLGQLRSFCFSIVFRPEQVWRSTRSDHWDHLLLPIFENYLGRGHTFLNCTWALKIDINNSVWIAQKFCVLLVRESCDSIRTTGCISVLK